MERGGGGRSNHPRPPPPHHHILFPRWSDDISFKDDVIVILLRGIFFVVTVTVTLKHQRSYTRDLNNARDFYENNQRIE
jgi:hypothetical protein